MRKSGRVTSLPELANPELQISRVTINTQGKPQMYWKKAGPKCFQKAAALQYHSRTPMLPSVQLPTSCVLQFLQFNLWPFSTFESDSLRARERGG